MAAEQSDDWRMQMEHDIEGIARSLQLLLQRVDQDNVNVLPSVSNPSNPASVRSAPSPSREMPHKPPSTARLISVLRSGSVRFFDPKRGNRQPQPVATDTQLRATTTEPGTTGPSRSGCPKKTGSNRFYPHFSSLNSPQSHQSLPSLSAYVCPHRLMLCSLPLTVSSL